MSGGRRLLAVSYNFTIRGDIGDGGLLVTSRFTDEVKSALAAVQYEEPNVPPQSAADDPEANASQIFTFGIISVMILACVLLALAGIHILARRSSPPDAQLMAHATVTLRFIDLMTDMLFTFSVLGPSDPLFLPAAVFLFLPAIVSFILGLMVVRRALKHPAFYAWADRRSSVLGIMGLMSLCGTDVLRIFSSKMFNLSVFSAPLSPSIVRFVDVSGLVSNILEDIPQLILQAMRASQGDLFTTISLVFTIVSISYGVVKRIMVAFMFRKPTKAQQDMVELAPNIATKTIVETSVSATSATDDEEVQDGWMQYCNAFNLDQHADGVGIYDLLTSSAWGERGARASSEQVTALIARLNDPESGEKIAWLGVPYLAVGCNSEPLLVGKKMLVGSIAVVKTEQAMLVGICSEDKNIGSVLKGLYGLKSDLEAKGF